MMNYQEINKAFMDMLGLELDPNRPIAEVKVHLTPSNLPHVEVTYVHTEGPMTHLTEMEFECVPKKQDEESSHE